MEVAVQNTFTVMAEVLPKNERTENILAQRAAADAAKNEKAEQVSPNLIRDSLSNHKLSAVEFVEHNCNRF